MEQLPSSFIRIVIPPLLLHSFMIFGENTQTRHNHEVFSAKNAAHLDGRLRRFLYRPDRLAERFIMPGNRVLDFGCGPGFFTREFAKRVGENGLVYSVDLQQEMLGILRAKLEPEGLMPQIRTHQCRPDSIGLPADLNGTFDIAFAIFVVHEVPDPAGLFREIAALLKPGGTHFYTEPPVIVSGREFGENLALAEEAGFRQVDRFLYFVNRAVVLRKG
jgi:ubiquinone/menaquinone biosynthesis C-methylase UbiE